MKTYAETQNEPPFDWNAKLDQFIAGEYPEEDETRWLDELAGSWVTCACGNQCAAISRDPDSGKPIDYELKRLGLNFSVLIETQDWCRAKSVLGDIEKRSSELLAELKGKQ